MVSVKKKGGIWLSFFILSPLIFYLALPTFSLEQVWSVDYMFFVMLCLLVSFYPIHTEKSILFLTNGVSVAVFIIYGLFAEIVVTTLALLALMLRSNIKSDEHYRYPLNLLMFQLLSLVSAFAYYTVLPMVSDGGMSSFSLTALIIYMLVHLGFNQIAMYCINRYLFNVKETELIDEDFKFSFYTSLFIVPLSFILIYLFEELHLNGIVIGAIPFLTITVGMNVFFKNQMNNTYLKKVNVLAQELTEKKKRSEVIETYLRSLAHIFPVDALSYFNVSNDGEVRRTVVFKENLGIEELNEPFSISEKSILNNAILNRTIIYYNRAADWRIHCINDICYHAESAMVLPVTLREDVAGLILISHKTKFMYNDMIVSLIRILHQYFSIALDNAHQYELLEENSETDYLTGLTNLKGFSKQLEKVISEENTCVSLIVMDLDHFKKTNDTYGHEAGNEVLRQVARLLERLTDMGLTVARYGGEEFIVLLPDYSKNEARIIAEDIRRKIESAAFTVQQSIKSSKPVIIPTTASLGVATYPIDCSRADELITVADKAMYIGSKQKGRNRVTIARKGRNSYEVKKIF
ncbi:sensor domain-containing diguanylate cyclase [Alkalibacterium pelagium]|uniref:Diguanylate cyclase (GGDEF) domain-containing protein n=2 Tax=Alkalibacterium TaxID=99906 RepID=A0A1H7KT45_9LACT|nr:sensor domain-containing diguanylate cyclase [Alkalibacterium pelagium]GEN50645.1 hypothetical protein APE02nite_13100 [Alkalibacterium pelagium]SEK90043.1 diguanylate cyclase (GGDEF) domain-containing protein [Alkalibacterium pelagium]